jgi:hypothetical protein
MRAWQRALGGALLVGAVAAVGIALNFTLLRLTQDSHDPVGKLSPRAVFSDQPATITTTVTTTTTTGSDDGSSSGSGHAPRHGDGDGDD